MSVAKDGFAMAIDFSKFFPDLFSNTSIHYFLTLMYFFATLLIRPSAFNKQPDLGSDTGTFID